MKRFREDWLPSILIGSLLIGTSVIAWGLNPPWLRHALVVVEGLCVTLMAYFHGRSRYYGGAVDAYANMLNWRLEK